MSGKIMITVNCSEVKVKKLREVQEVLIINKI
jgi:hypothetical protein